MAGVGSGCGLCREGFTLWLGGYELRVRSFIRTPVGAGLLENVLLQTGELTHILKQQWGQGSAGATSACPGVPGVSVPQPTS